MGMDVQSYLIGHLGIVAGIFDKLNIADVIDRILPKRGSRNLLHSVIIKAMILNGFGFTSQATIPVFQLFHDDSYGKVTWQRHPSSRPQ